MPELPEVETVMRGLSPVMSGARILRVTQRRDALRFPFPADFARRLEGRSVSSMTRRAKYILAHLDDGAALIMHLGMTGRFVVELDGSFTPGLFVHEQPRHLTHDHVVFELSHGARITYNDVRRFGYMDLARSDALAESPHFIGLGVEPLGNSFDAAMLGDLLQGKKAPLKAALLDQRLIAGLGNIYVCETLHRAGLSPLRAAGSIVGAGKTPSRKLIRLAAEIRAVLEEAIIAGGSTLRDFAATDGALGYFQHSFKAYGREGEACLKPGCNGSIQRNVQSGRSTFWCATCQR